MKRKHIHAFLIFFALFASSACSRAVPHYNVYGANEFVLDSYKIRQGKLSILEMQGISLQPITFEAMEEYSDVIAEDDILQIVLYHPKRQDLMHSIQRINETIGFPVTNGAVSLPDTPSVPVAGLSLEEARMQLRGALLEQIQDVDLFVSYKQRLGRKVELIGEVSAPVIPVDGRIRLYEVLARAGVRNQANLFMSYVVRENQPLAIDLSRLVNEGDMSQNIVMRGGDKVYLAAPQESNVMVMGEVLTPKAVNVPRGFISLREALVMAGGIPYTGNRDCIQVIRGNLQCPKIYLLSWDHIVHLPNDSLLLMPGDTIYVTEKPITQWNRFIDQLLPSWTGMERFYATYRLLKE